VRSIGSALLHARKRTKKPMEALPVHALKAKIESELALAAGTSMIKSRDPIYHITESFKSTFDLTGRIASEQYTGESTNSFKQETTGELNKEDVLPDISYREENVEKKFGEPVLKPEDNFPTNKNYPEQEVEGGFYHRFARTAFNKGNLASAVLQNGGKAMFVSCLRRALGQSLPNNIKQTMLFSSSSVNVPVPNFPGRVMFNRYTQSAVGLVIDSICSASRTLEFFERFASEDSESQLEGNGIDTMRIIYPFLSTSKEAKMRKEYEGKLRELTEEERAAAGDRDQLNRIAAQKTVVEAGLTKTSALIAKKKQVRRNFLSEIVCLLENSRKAEMAFSAPGFVEEVVEELLNPAEPPEDDGNDKDKDDKGKSDRGREGEELT
jgi:hypothetical protein